MKKGFTLIELLVVVLIIGILAAIALPKYQMAVAKSHFATLKAQTKAIAEAVNRYQLATGSLPKSFKDLDISFDNVKSYGDANPETDAGASITFSHNPNEISACQIWYKNKNYSGGVAGCWYKNPSSKNLLYTHSYIVLRPRYCGFSPRNNSIFEKVCQQETGKPYTDLGTYVLYYY